MTQQVGGRRKTPEEHQADIVQAALAVAARYGVEAVTVRAVAAEAGVAVGGVHYYFKDKSELMRAMGAAIALAASTQMLDALHEGDDPHTLTRAGAESMLAGLKANQRMRLLTFEFAIAGCRDPVMQEVALGHLEQSYTMTQDYLRRQAERASVRFNTDLKALAIFVAGQIDGIEIAWLVNHDDDAALRAFHDLAAVVRSHMVPIGVH